MSAVAQGVPHVTVSNTSTWNLVGQLCVSSQLHVQVWAPVPNVVAPLNAGAPLGHAGVPVGAPCQRKNGPAQLVSGGGGAQRSAGPQLANVPPAPSGNDASLTLGASFPASELRALDSPRSRQPTSVP